ncbi:MAG: hypothetical protein J6Z40_09395 [Oscillospiraceae bacterium]|nr:hypothetical protein [Oscillospiraceae bacterium]MBQ5339365.1 hypothetical protein [Oscillospiraceae bacterium]
MKYEDLNVGVKAPYKEIKQFFGEELTFKELVYVPGTEKLLILLLCTVNGIEEDDDIYVGQITRVVDNEEGYEEYADVILDIPGYDQKPICIDFDDMEVPQLDEDDDPEIISNCYARIWRIRKPLPALEQLAIGAAAYGKCKSNLIDTTEDLLEAFRTGAIKTVLKSDAIRSVKQVLTVAGIQIPEEEPNQETAIVAAQPAELDPVDQAKQLHQRILTDAQSAAESLYDMCKAIKEMRDGKHYKALLYDNFEGYCEEALGMSRSHAYRYIQIAEGMSAENVSQLAQIGTTKLALLASVTDEQREIVTTAVDVESATVKELKAEIDKLQGKVKQAEQEKLAAENMQSIERSHRKEADAAFERAQSRIRVLEAEKQQNADRKELLDAADNQIRRLNAEIANNSDYIAKLQEKITELENRPVEVAVQEESDALEQLRKEYEEKLHDQEAEIRKLEDELNDRDDNDHFLRLDINYREARVKVQTLCTMVANLNDCKEKDTLKQNIRNIIYDIEQRIGKE